MIFLYIYDGEFDDPDYDQETYSEFHNRIRPEMNCAKGNWSEYNQEYDPPFDYSIGDFWDASFHEDILMTNAPLERDLRFVDSSNR